MLSYDDRIAIGVSGGKDSMTLLHILTRIEKAFPHSELKAITIDEGIQGYREEALKIAKDGCQKLNIEHEVFTFKEIFGCELDSLVKKYRQKNIFNENLTPCAICGVLRRRALNSAARNEKATKLATAHNLDDEAQTIMLNILRGDPLRIGRGTPVSCFTNPFFVGRIKPFCEILEREIVLYAYLKKIRFQNIPCPYAAEAFRNDVRSTLNRMEEKHPSTKYSLYHSAQKLRPFLETATKAEDLRNCEVCGEPTVNTVCQSCKMLIDIQESELKQKS
jgi:uncharacterized protein (TIGR00269 family)